MTVNQSKALNVLGLMALDTVLVLAFVDQLWFRDLPCPICILQRVGFIAAGFGLALNLIFGPRPSHYGIVLLGAMVGGVISAHQITWYIVPGTGSYGNAIFGLHLYTWALMAFALMVLGTAIMLMFDRQFAGSGHLSPPWRVLSVSAVTLLGLLAVANVVSTLFICGLGTCPEIPSGYLIFRENLGLALLGQAP